MSMLSSGHIRFRDLSLRNKLILSIILCIILPIFIIAMIIGQNITRESLKRAQEHQLLQMEKSMEDIDLVYEQVEDLKTTFQLSYDIQKIVKGSATAKDFYLAGTRIGDLTQTASYIYAITLSTAEGIIFQQDKFLLYEKPEYFDQAIREGVKGFWTETYSLDNAFFEKDKVLQVQTNFSLINQVQNLDQTLTVLGISIKEEYISKLLLSTFESEGAVNLLIREDGLVLSSHDKSLIGTDFHETVARFEGRSGVIDGDDRMSICYSRSSRGDSYLVCMIPKKALTSAESTLYVTIGLAIFLSAVFAIVFSFIQNHYIIQPLGELLHNMEKVQAGDFSVEEKTHTRDEIGYLSERFDQMRNRLRKMIDEVYLSKIHEQEARYTALLSQLNPHFLYNTLDSIHWLAIKHQDHTVGEQIETLSDVFRHVLSEGRNYVRIEEELKFVEDYMLLMRARHGDRIRLLIEIEKGLEGCLIPKLIIQPLVENAILHGLESKVEGGTIRITIASVGNRIQFIVSDDGIGADQKQVLRQMDSGDELSSAFALRNIHKRLKLSYGQEYGITIESSPNEGFTVRMFVPRDAGADR